MSVRSNLLVGQQRFDVDAAGLATAADRGPQSPQGENRSSWTAQWIGAHDMEPPSGVAPGLDGEAVHNDFETLLFRGDFHLVDPPPSAMLRIASDSRHIVWVNGREVCRGPVRSQPDRLIADEIEIGNLLIEGDNTLAVEVTYYGEPNAYWMPARSSGGLGTAAVLLAEVVLPERGLVIASTDSAWRVWRCDAATRLPRTDVEGVPAEILDARRRHPSWQVSTIPDTWARASLVRAGHISSGGQSRPPAEPYGQVPSRTRPTDVAKVIEPRSSWHRPVGRPPARQPGAHPSSQVRLAEKASGSIGDGVPSPMRGSVVTYDFGRVVFGLLEVEVDASSGVEFDFDLRETAAATPGDGLHGLRYFARGGQDRFVSREPHGFRFASITALGDNAEDARILRFVARDAKHSRTGRAWFRSSDAELDEIWAAGVRTVALCSTDAYVDCPTREQRAWVGDGVVDLEVDLYTNADRELARRYLELCASPTSAGLLPMSVAGDIEDAAATTIPAFSLYWIHALHLYALHEGLDDLVSELLPVAERALRWFARYQDDRGVLDSLPGWTLVDWSSVYTDGRSSVYTGLWARALAEFESMSGTSGNAASARWARQRYLQAQTGFEDFWCPSRQLYLDRPDDGTYRSKAASQLASASAMVSGVVPVRRQRDLAVRISDPARLVTRSWLWRPVDGFDVAAMEAGMLNHPEPDWDAVNEIVRAEPFGSSIVHDALSQAGCTEGLVRSIRSWRSFLNDGYDTFGEGWGWGTRVHGWSSAPTRDLLAHTLGLRPKQYGGELWTVAPKLGSLEFAEGAIETKQGLLSIKVDRKAIEIDTPVSVEVETANGPAVYGPGQHRATLPC